MKIWDLRTGQETAEINRFWHNVTRVRYSPSAQQLFVCSLENIHVFDCRQAFDRPCVHLLRSSGTRVDAAGAAAMLSTNENRHQPPAGEFAVRDMYLAPDSSHLWTVGQNCIRLWDTRSCKSVNEYRIGGLPACDLACMHAAPPHEGGMRMAVGGRDRTVRVSVTGTVERVFLYWGFRHFSTVVRVVDAGSERSADCRIFTPSTTLRRRSGRLFCQ